LSKLKKILLATFFVGLVSYNPGAHRESMTYFDKLVPGNIRLNNSYSDSREFDNAERTVTSFMRKWSIAGASIAISKDGMLVDARVFCFSDTTTKE